MDTLAAACSYFGSSRGQVFRRQVYNAYQVAKIVQKVVTICQCFDGQRLQKLQKGKLKGSYENTCNLLMNCV